MPNAAELGDVLTKAKGARADLPKRVRLTARAPAGGVVVEPVDEFGPPLPLTAAELLAAYGAAPAEPADEQQLAQQADREAAETHLAAFGYRPGSPQAFRAANGDVTEGPPIGSPEQQFAALADKG